MRGAVRYRRPSERRTLDTLNQRMPAIEAGNPYPTFRAAISEDFENDLSLSRRAYDVAVIPDTVFWDYWNDNYNREIFAPLTQTEFGRTQIGAVELLVPGLYVIQAAIDWSTNFATDPPLTGAFNTWLASNYDDGGTQLHYFDLTSDILGMWTLNQFRYLWPAYTGSENFVEITVGHDNVAQSPLYIPGGNGGHWSFPPMLNISYLGGFEGQENFMENDDDFGPQEF